MRKTMILDTVEALQSVEILCNHGKKEHNLKHYFNCPGSPDLAPIENCWWPPKQFMVKFPHWDEFETSELALEWQKVLQHFINEQVDSMPCRLQDCIDLESQMME
jgi:hypothetical protein